MSDQKNNRDPLFNFDMSSLFEMLGGEDPRKAGAAGRRPSTGSDGEGNIPRQPGKPLRTPRQPGKRSPITITLLIIAGIALFIYLAVSLWTEILWFNQVDYARIL